MVLSENNDIQYVVKQVGEIALPIALLDMDQTIESIEFVISASKDGKEIDRTPLLKFMIKLEDVKLYNWTI
jgi:hypothetical protein